MKKYNKKIIKLNNGLTEEYFINTNPKAHIAQVKKDKKIYVNKDFDKLSLLSQKVIIYHERGHKTKSNLIIRRLAIIFEIIFILTIIHLLLYLRLPEQSIISMSKNIILVMLSLTSFIGFVWLNEVISDFNSVKNMGKELTIQTIGDIYSKKRFNIWNDWVMHPPWKLRKKIMGELD